MGCSLVGQVEQINLTIIFSYLIEKGYGNKKTVIGKNNSQ